MTVDPDRNDSPAAKRNGSYGPGKIYDGLTNTILLTENINAGGPMSWGDPNPQNSTFVYPMNPDTRSYSSSDYFAKAPLHSSHSYGLINGAGTGPDGARPFPNSGHSGIVNVVFCNGSTRTISEQIDPSIYARLITPEGSKPLLSVTAQAPISGSSF
jgi:hypothetical protein